MKLKFIKTAFICMLFAAIASIPAFAASIGGAKVDISAINMRSGPSSSTSLLAVVPKGELMVVEEKAGSWYKVVYKGTEGYAFADYVEYSETLEGDFGAKGAVDGSSVHLREKPSLDAKILGSTNTGSSYDIVGVSGKWIKVKTTELGECWISSDYLSLNGKTKATAKAAASKGEELAASAKEYLGCKYVWGGMSPAGFDCSGFVNYVYDLYGYDLERVAQDIYDTNGTAVDKESLQPGDIVCFGSSGKSINHVGIYIGDGQFIHSGSSSTGVIITEMDSSYYSGRFQGGKRIITG